MKKTLIVLGLIIASCVPAKKYNELLEREETCSSELEKYKGLAIDFESKLKSADTELKRYKEECSQLISDTSQLGTRYRNLNTQYLHSQQQLEKLESQFNQLQSSSSASSSSLGNTLEAQRLDLQQQQDRLTLLSEELTEKAAKLKDREARVKELEELLSNQENALKALKEKVAQALLGFKDKGLTVEEKNGRIYVSMEAKLLFASGSTDVDSQGKDAIIQLAVVLEDQEEIDIVVEGHTDSDDFKSSKHPKNNWELSVLRATSVVKIMLESSEVSPNILSASGRGKFHPVDPNNKAKNRRIEIIISPKLDALFEIINQ
jgi:chemotaxis protein MotB